MRMKKEQYRNLPLSVSKCLCVLTSYTLRGKTNVDQTFNYMKFGNNFPRKVSILRLKLMEIAGTCMEPWFWYARDYS